MHVGKGQQVKCIGQFNDDEEDKAYEAYLEAVGELNQGKTLESIKIHPHPHSSKYKGVSWDKNKQKWVAIITRKGKKKFLGQFKEDEE